MSEQEWRERGLPMWCVDPLTGRPSRVVFVEAEVGPGEDEGDDEEREAA